VSSKWRDQLKQLVWFWRKVDILHTECDGYCDANIDANIDCDCLKCSINFSEKCDKFH